MTDRPAVDARRPDIQGLRAVAVLVVIGFHAGLALPGGFVGVDVFFVISGFVITAMLAREWERTGTVRLGAFYLRRVRRLTPALALVVAATLVLSGLLLSPFGEQQVAARTGLGAIALCANWVIATLTGDYFAPDAEGNPLLHTWSLSVEEQFYLAFPLLVLLGWRAGRRRGAPRLVPLLLVAALGLGSLAMLRGGSLGIPAGSWLLGFYSPVNRAWEFASGALLALLAHRVPRSRWVAVAASATGLVMLVASLVLIDGETPFPGKWTMLPVTATVLLIAAGTGVPDSPVSRLLGTAPMVRVGDWSYSLYLWHWPVIVLATTVWPTTPWAAPVAAAASVLPAVASYRFVEQPFRSRPTRPRRRFALAATGIVAVPTVLAGLVWSSADRFWAPAYRDGTVAVAYPQTAAERETSRLPETPGRPCTAPEVQALIGLNGLCRQSSADPGVEVAVLGDSHAEHVYPGLAERLPDRNVALYSFRAPMMFGRPAQLEVVLDRLAATESLELVLISRYWSRDGLSPTRERDPLARSVRRLVAAGKQVVVTDDVPDYPFDVAACRDRAAPVLPWSRCSRDRQAVMEEVRLLTRGLRHTVDGVPGARLVASHGWFCDGRSCSMVRDGTVLYGDADHLNADGSRYLAGRLLAVGALDPVR